MPTRRLPRMPTCAAAVLVLLAACGSPEAATPGTGTDGGSVEASVPAGAPAQECAPAPPAPGQASTFGALPSPEVEVPGPREATITTTCGPITVELLAAEAPTTVSSFAFLAREGYWADSPCHRLTTTGIFVLQCGDPTGTGRGAPGYTFGIENAPADGTYPRGTLAMARSTDPDSNGGQFFVVYEDTRLPVDGGGYTIFGRVTEGMEIVDQVAAAGVAGGGPDGTPAQPISILSVEVAEEESGGS